MYYFFGRMIVSQDLEENRKKKSQKVTDTSQREKPLKTLKT